MADDPCAANYFSQYFSGNLLLCQQKPKLVTQEQAQIQSVADNAKQYYGAGSVTAAVAQATADAQKAVAQNDVTTITNLNASDCSGIDLSFIGADCIEWWKIGLVGGLIAALILLPYLLPFILRPRR